MKKVKVIFSLVAFFITSLVCVAAETPVIDNPTVAVELADMNYEVSTAEVDMPVKAEHAIWILAAALLFIPSGKKQVFGFNAYFNEADVMPFTVAQKALWDYLMESGDVNTINALKKRELAIVSYAESLKFQVPISSGNRVELLNATAVYRQGRIPQEYNQGFLPKGFNIAVNKIRAAYGTDAALLPEAIVNYTTIAAGWPAALQHGQFIISQNGAVKEQFTGRVAGSAAAAFGSAIDTDGYELQSPMILEEGKPIKIELYCPQAVTFPATPAILAVAVEFLGACIRPRS
jgi:hypothetical protein